MYEEIFTYVVHKVFTFVVDFSIYVTSFFHRYVGGFTFVGMFTFDGLTDLTPQIATFESETAGTMFKK